MENLYRVTTPAPLNGQLGINEFCSLIEASIKMFAFQRGQIHLPFDSIMRKKLKNVPILTPEVDAEELEEPEDCPEFKDPMERIRILRDRRRQMMIARMEEKKSKRIEGIERYILSSFDTIFQKTRCTIKGLGPCSSEIKGIMILFGPSIHSPKEIIILDLDPNLVKFDEEAVENQKEISGVFLRNFFKSIIMSSDYMDFSEKQLRSTLMNLYLLSRKEFESNQDDLRYLEGLTLQNAIGRRTTKTFIVKLKNMNEEYSTNIFNGDSFIYQIPYNFKGVKSKNI